MCLKRCICFANVRFATVAYYLLIYWRKKHRNARARQICAVGRMGWRLTILSIFIRIKSINPQTATSSYSICFRYPFRCRHPRSWPVFWMQAISHVYRPRIHRDFWTARPDFREIEDFRGIKIRAERCNNRIQPFGFGWKLVTHT